MSRRAEALTVGLGLAAQLTLAGLFLWAGLEKIAEPAALALDITHYQLVPVALTPWLALLIPCSELVVGVGVLMPPLRRGAAAMIAVLLAIFATAMLQAKLRGIDLACGCFGAATESQVTWLSVLRNLGLCGVALWLASPWSKTPTQRPLPSGSR